MTTKLTTSVFPFVLLKGPISSDIRNTWTLGNFFLNFAIRQANGFVPIEEEKKPSAPTFQTFIETRYLPYIHTRKRSFATDERLLKRHVYPMFSLKPIDAITPEEIEAWKIAFKEKGYAAASINRVLAVLKYVFTCAVRWKLIAVNPAKDVENLRVVTSRERHLSFEEARRLVKELQRYPRKREAKAIELLLLTGARKSEILNARWENVNFAEKTLTVPLSKSGLTRFIPLSSAAIAVLKSLRGSAVLTKAKKRFLAQIPKHMPISAVC